MIPSHSCNPVVLLQCRKKHAHNNTDLLNFKCVRGTMTRMQANHKQKTATFELSRRGDCCSVRCE